MGYTGEMTNTAATPTLTEASHPYLDGQCHVLAVALHRQLGWNLVLVLGEAFFWEDPQDCDNGIPEVIHAYAVDEQGQAWDIRGPREAETIREDCAEHFVMEAGSLDTDWLRSEAELRMYVGEWAEEGEDPIDRPLGTYTQADIDQAWDVAQAVLGDKPGWPKMLPTPASQPRAMRSLRA